MTDILNVSQYRCIYLTLRTLEERLRQAAAWLQGAEEQGQLYQRTLKLSPERRALAQQQVNEALALLTDLAQTLGLEAETDEAAGHIRAALSVSWADLCDARSSKLQRYGAVHPGLAAVLDPSIERLAELALSIANLMQHEA